MTQQEGLRNDRVTVSATPGPGQRLALAVAAVLVALALVGGQLLVDPGGRLVQFDDARSMADRAGCADTFTPSTAYAGVRSAGTCSIHGAEVILVVLPGIDAAYAWFEGANALAARPHHGVVGDGWVAYGDDVDVMSRVAQSLTTPTHPPS